MWISKYRVIRTDQARFLRERAARWEDRRLNVYSDYARSLKAIISLTFRVSAHFGNDPNPHPLKPEDAAPQLGTASEYRDLAWETLLLLGTPDAVEAAHEWAVTVAEMERFAQERTHDPDGWSAFLDKQRAARERYYEAARRDIALPSGHTGRWRVMSSKQPLNGPTTGPHHPTTGR